MSLIKAIEKGDTIKARILITSGKEINKSNKQGETPLIMACIREKQDIVKLLLEKGANPNRGNKQGETPLYVACEFGNIGIVKLLLGYGANINTSNKQGETPLYIACKNNENLKIIKLLLKNGAEVNRGNKQGETPLYIAGKRGEVDMIKLLFEHGADIYLDISNEEFPLVYASRINIDFHSNIKEELIKLFKLKEYTKKSLSSIFRIRGGSDLTDIVSGFLVFGKSKKKRRSVKKLRNAIIK